MNLFCFVCEKLRRSQMVKAKSTVKKRGGKTMGKGYNALMCVSVQMTNTLLTMRMFNNCM
jgi:hypothetical protein